MTLVIKKKGIFADHTGRRVAVVLEELRSTLSRVRGQLSDIGFEYSGLRERLNTAEEGCTLVISYLYGEIDAVKKLEIEQAKLEVEHIMRETNGGST